MYKTWPPDSRQLSDLQLWIVGPYLPREVKYPQTPYPRPNVARKFESGKKYTLYVMSAGVLKKIKTVCKSRWFDDEIILESKENNIVINFFIPILVCVPSNMEYGWDTDNGAEGYIVYTDNGAEKYVVYTDNGAEGYIVYAEEEAE